LNLALSSVCSRALDIFFGVGPIEELEGNAAKEQIGIFILPVSRGY
jgi:hypothetical protein